MAEVNNNYENHPLYNEYLNTTKNPSSMGFDQYCWEQYCIQQEEQWKRYLYRNLLFLTAENHAGTFNWVTDYLKASPSSMSRHIEGDTFFNAHLTVMACFNSLMMELSRDELNEKETKRLLDKIRENMTIISTMVDSSSQGNALTKND